ncbi:hypothetical protein V8F20_008781 [Naviculisporaceae sp. PSN 640]
MKLPFALVHILLWTLTASASHHVTFTDIEAQELFDRHPTTPRHLTSAQVRRELGKKLSKTTLIYGPEDSQFHEATSRWSEFAHPNVSVVVLPGEESDVPTIVKYANKKSIPFLATSGRHGFTRSLSTFSGLEISLRQLNNVRILPSKKSALIGGGSIVGDIIHPLWEQGYLTTTGSCECVGFGAALGGGHGRLEGYHGMISDNILQYNVVLADGRSIVVSKDHHSDLLWGMRGAGHQFGIVTSYELKIYPRVEDTWHYHNYIYTGDKLERVFEAINRFHGNGSTPVRAALNGGFFQWNEERQEPVIFWTFAWRGSATEAELAWQEFNEIESIWDEQGDVSYPEIFKKQGLSLEDIGCQHGSTYTTSTAGLEVYNVTVERQIFDGFVKRAREDPDLVKSTAIVHEGYSTKGVTAIPGESSAYPFRADHHLMLFMAAFPVLQDGDLAGQERVKKSWEWASEVRDLWNSGQRPGRTVNTYVNYASGDESVESMYGYDSWRLERLRALKKKYDPENRFRSYNPIL